MKRSFYIIGGIILAISIPSHLLAQTTQPKDTTMNRTVVVEQEYNPDIMDASKVNVLPKVEEPTVSKKEVEYATTFFPATSVPAGLMNPYTGKEIAPGYVRAGYGNLGNLDILANYLFRLSKKDKLNVRFQMDGMDGKLTLPYTDGEKWNAFYYRTRANVDYTHQFNKLDLNIAGNFGLSNFNFLPGSVNSKQKFTSGDFHAGIHFIDETAPLRFNAETNLLMYERQHNMISENDANTAIKETIIRTKGDVTGAINDQQSVTIALEMNNLLYSGYTKNPSTGDEYFKNYTTLLVNPYYELNNDDWKLHIGANIDLSFGFDKSFRISPDVTAQYIFSDSYIVYAKATGGKQLNDFRRLENICPYGELPNAGTLSSWGYVQRPVDTYEQINGSAGFKASPYPGVWFNVYGGYQNLKNDLSYFALDSDNSRSDFYLSFIHDNTDNFYLGGEISYDYKDIVGISAKYTYRNWDSKTEKYLLAVKPVSELSFNVHIHPISALNVNLGYDYVDREEIKLDDYSSMSAINDLHIGANYNIFKGISVYAQAHNLLNKKYQYYLGYPAKGFNFLGGLSFRF